MLFATIWFVCKSNIILQMRRDSLDSAPDKLAYHRASASLEKRGFVQQSCMQYYCINLSTILFSKIKTDTRKEHLILFGGEGEIRLIVRPISLLIMGQAPASKKRVRATKLHAVLLHKSLQLIISQ